MVKTASPRAPYGVSHRPQVPSSRIAATTRESVLFTLKSTGVVAVLRTVNSLTTWPSLDIVTLAARPSGACSCSPTVAVSRVNLRSSRYVVVAAVPAQPIHNPVEEG